MAFNLRVFSLIIFIVLSIYNWGRAQHYSPAEEDPLSQLWRWKQFPELEGKGIRNIYQGKDNKVWIAFNGGIYEYNGYLWKEHNQDNGLMSAPVEFVYGADDGKLYAASADGIFKLNGEAWESIFITPEDVTFQFTNLTELGDGRIAAPSNRGLVLIDDRIKILSSEEKINQIKTYLPEIDWITLPDELIPEDGFLDVSDVLLDREDRIWLAITLNFEKGRLLTFDRKELVNSYISKYRVYTSNQRIAFGESQRLEETQDGSIWVINTTYKTGINIWKDGNWKTINLSDQFSSDEYMTDIVESDDGTIWIASLGKLYSFRDNGWNMYSAPAFPIPANRLILQKSTGKYLWVAGYKSRLFYVDYSDDHWVSYQGLNFQFDDSNQSTWFISAEGEVVKKTDSTWVSYTVNDGLIDAPIRLFHTSAGQVWAAGSHQGVAATAVLKGRDWEKFTFPELSWGIDYRAVFEDNAGGLWFGGAVDAELEKGQRGGVVKMLDPLDNPQKWIHYPSSERGLQQSNIYGIGQSQDGRIWVGGGNLYSFDGEIWQRHPDSRLQQFVNVVCSDHGLLFAGSRYYGVFCFDGKNWKNYDNTNGLSGNTIISIDIIAPDCIYVATENDICRFDGTKWVQNVFPSELNMEFEGGTLTHDSNGTLWINKSSRAWKRRAMSLNTSNGEKEGFACYRYIPDNIPPETQISMYTKEVSSAGNTLIKWEGHDYFGHSANKDLMFSYKLGDEDWSSFMKDQHFTFMSLTHGVYSLQVRARDMDMNIDPTPAIITFSVLPPVWKQTWFISLISAFLTILGIIEYQVLTKKRKLELLNNSLQKANNKLELKSAKIVSQNEEILLQQKHILAQAEFLEDANKNLEERNKEINHQKDQLEDLVIQIEELSRAKLEFFTNISHELRTPLTLITGPINQLIKQEKQLSDDSRVKLYQIIERNTVRLHKLINQLLELRRIENKNLDLKYVTISLPDFLRDIVKLFENLAFEKGIYLDFVNDCQPSEFVIDPDKLEKVVVNLLSNAFKHTSAGDRIQLRLTSQPIVVGNGIPATIDAGLQISVEDTGMGIRKEDLVHIFERFYSTEHQSSEEGIRSSGIGLAYIKELIELMKGDIKVKSKPGFGTKFIVNLPCPDLQVNDYEVYLPTSLHIAKQEADFLMQSLYEDRSDLGIQYDPKDRKRILIVDDQEDMLFFIESILAEEYEVLKAENGLEALEIAQNQSIDFIISDVLMPKMDGLTFCREIKSQVSTSHIPVLLLTAKVMDENRIEGFAEGADAYLTKPFDPELLLARISNLFQQRDQLREAFSRDFLLSPQKINLTGPDEELLTRIVEIMEENIEDANFNIDQMCKMVNLSHMHFIRKVKQLTGKKPIDLLKSFRLKRAKDLLLQHKLTISEIAFKVGYNLPNSFSRAFKKEFGMSPKEFINSKVST